MAMEQKKKRKRIPYGIVNFADIRRDNSYYVDKTSYIEQIEDANKYFFFIRPRRFGKSSLRKTSFRNCSVDCMWASILPKNGIPILSFI
jgi:hypothetical protein